MPETIYPTRDERIDSLRGLFIAIMLINHLALPISKLTYHSLGVVSLAGGFIFLSGLIGGIVYTRQLAKYNTSYLFKKVYKRAGVIYGAHILTIAAIAIIFFCLPYYFAHWRHLLPHLNTNTAEILALSAVLLYQPRNFDILPMYCVFFLLLPPVIYTLVRNHTLWVLAGSFFVWLIPQLIDFKMATYRFGQLLIVPGYFNYLAWQFLFFIGVILGVRTARGKSLTFLHSKSLAVVSLVIFLVFFLIRHSFITPVAGFRLMVATSMNTFAWLQLVNFLALAHLSYLLASARYNLFIWPFFALIGRYALMTFSVHILLVYLAMPWLRPLTYRNPLLQLLFSGLFVFVLYALARLYHAWKMKNAPQPQ
jgi:hypothetical protein